MKRTIEFTHSGHSNVVGNFASGDSFSGDAELCRHFVEEAGCAKWVDAVQAPAAAKTVPAKTGTPKKKRG